MQSKAVVTGGTGFIGSHLVDYLISKDYEVVVPVRKGSNMSFLNKKAIVVNADLENLVPLTPHIRESEYIFHLAGLTKTFSTENIYKINTHATGNLVDFCVQNKGDDLKRFIFMSSQAASSPSAGYTRKVNEATACQPVTHYGKSKLQAEHLVMRHRDELPVTIIRPPTVYGPREREVFTYFKLAHLGFIPIVGDPKRTFSIVHIKDLIDGMMTAAQSQESQGEIYFISDCSDLSWENFAWRMQKCVHDVTGKKSRIFHVPDKLTQNIIRLNELYSRLRKKPTMLTAEKYAEMSHSWVCDPSRICNIGFKPKVKLEDGLWETYCWYLMNFWLN